MDFKQLVLDVLTEEVLTSKCKFQPGDIVIIRAAYRAATKPFVNTIAKVENDRQTGNQMVLYKVKVKDGTSHYVSSGRLDGPFKDAKVAKKYLDPNIDIEPSDLLRRYEVLDNWQTRPKTENQLKAVLTAPPFNLTWFDQPIEVPASESWSGRVTFILAQSPLNKQIQVKRHNSLKTKKLTPEGYELYLCPENTLLSVLQNIHAYLWNHLIRPGEFFKNLDKYKQSFKALEILGINLSDPEKAIIDNTMLRRVLEECPLLNFFKEQHPTDLFITRNSIGLNNITPDAFKGVPVNDLQVESTSNGDLVGCPEVVHGNFTVLTNYRHKLKTLKGCPKYIGGNFIFHNLEEKDITNIDFISAFPEHIGGQLLCPRLNDVTFNQLVAFIQRKQSLQDFAREVHEDPELSDLRDLF